MTQLERLTILRALANIADIGWQPTETQLDSHDLSDCFPTPDALSCLEYLEATGDALIYVHHEQSQQTRWIRIILGNDGWDSISDYSCPRSKIEEDDFDRAMTEAADWGDAYSQLLTGRKGN